MSEPTGEWTAGAVRRFEFDNPDRRYDAIADAHNAALAAEREKSGNLEDDLKEALEAAKQYREQGMEARDQLAAALKEAIIIKALVGEQTKQLDAERERTGIAASRVMNLEHESKQLREQLAAEREKRGAVTGSSDEVIEIDADGEVHVPETEIQRLHAQLAAEREDREERAELAQVTTLPSAAQLTWGEVLQEEIQQLRQQLAAEREGGHWRIISEQLKAELAAAVEALKEMRGYDADRVDRWLAKVEGKR